MHKVAPNADIKFMLKTIEAACGANGGALMLIEKVWMSAGIVSHYQLLQTQSDAVCQTIDATLCGMLPTKEGQGKLKVHNDECKLQLQFMTCNAHHLASWCL